MFLWKNTIVLLGLLGIASLPALALARAKWEHGYHARLIACAAVIACIAMTPLPMVWTQLAFAVLVVLCFDRRAPMGATYLFLMFWTPAAGTLLTISGSYIAPITPFLSFSAALLAGYLLHPEVHQRRRMVASDIWLLAFVLMFCVAMSLRDTLNGTLRTLLTYAVPYLLTFHVLSRVRIPRPELVLRLLVWGAGAAAMLCLFESLRHWPLYAGVGAIRQDIRVMDIPIVWLERGGILRAHGPFAHPLTGGEMLSLALIAAWALILLRGRTLPLVSLALLILLGAASTVSRSGLVAFAVGIATFQLLRGRYTLAVLVPLAGFVMLVALPILGGDDAQFSSEYRLDLAYGVPKALGHHVWFGFREAIEQHVLDRFIQGQGIVDLVNTYVGLIVLGGVASLIPFVLFMLSSYGHYRAIRRMKPDREHLLLAQALISIQTGLIVSLSLLAAWAAPMQVGFIVAALLIALRGEVARARAAAAPSKPPLVATLPVDQGERLPALR